MTELTEQRKREIAEMARRDLNAHAWLCEQEQEEYATEVLSLQQQVNTLTKQIEAALTDLEAYKPLTAIVVLKSAIQSIKESPREEQGK
jgi:uncharacterized protein with PhoU and TrkA domain